MRYLVYAATLLFLLSMSPAVQAGKGQGDCCPVCNSCDYVCEFSVEKATETKTAFDVECKAICIPAITFPWEKGHGKGKGGDCAEPPRCGKVKIVRVLVEHTYECTRCKCKWSAVPIGGKKAGGDSGSGSDVPAPPTVQAQAAPAPFNLLVNFSQFGVDISRRFVTAVRGEATQN